MTKVLLFVFLSATLVLAGSATHELAFNEADLRFSEHHGFDVVEHARGHLVAEPGRPALPVVSCTFLVPAHARVTSVSAVPVSTRELGGDWNIIPAQEPRPISSHDEPAFVSPDPAVYGSSNPWPADVVENWSQGNAGGFRLVSVDVCPLEYLPAESRLSLHTRVELRVEWQDHGLSEQVLTGRQRDRTAAGIRNLVANPEDLKRFSPVTAQTDLEPVDLLVITSERLAAEFQPYIEYRTQRGVWTELRTVEWAALNYPGRDLAERLRNMVRDFYEHRGLSYVLLAGDNQLVPSRRIRVYVGQTQGDVPTDLYFGDLDWSWDSNRNNLFGEMADSVDLYADVTVGRASVDNADQVRNFIAKVRTYESDPAPDYIKRALLPSGWLWRSIGYHGRFVNDSIANLTPGPWSDVEMVNPAGAGPVADSFDHGFAIFDPAGHGNEIGVYDEDGTPIYVSSVARRQTNNRRFTIMTSLACTPGNFEAEDCIAELAHNCVDGGCIAVMMNSRYGWGTPPQMGPSEKLCVRFYDFLFSGHNDVIGDCHARSREVYSGSAAYNSLWRWCMTEFNLLGDPCLDIWSEAPNASQVLCQDTTITTGERTLNVYVNGCDGPVSGALVCAWKDGEVFASRYTDGSGEVALDVHPVTPGELVVTATAHNWLPSSQTVRVTQGAPEPVVVLLGYGIDDTNQPHENGVLEPGETVALSLSFRNSGTAEAQDASVTLRPLGTGITVPDSTAELGTIPAQDSVSTSDLAVTAEPDALPGSSPEMLATVVSGSYTWELVFRLPLGYPGRAVAEVDTGVCALSVTARGAIGFDTESGRQGRGFRFPKTDTSSLNIGSFCVANSEDYVVDRFYELHPSRHDHDWQLADSLRTYVPVWNSQQLLIGRFTDAGHPDARGIEVTQRALGITGTDEQGFIVLAFDVANYGSQNISGLYAGILADFDVVAADRFHDLAYTDRLLRTAYMRNVNTDGRVCGIKLLSPASETHLACLDHNLYVYPDSGLSESMKYRALTGTLGVACSDRNFNWSVAASAGPFDLSPAAYERVVFAFVAAGDSAVYLDACRSAQEWHDNNVGVAELPLAAPATRFRLLAGPNPFVHEARIHLVGSPGTRVRVEVFDAAGRCVDVLHDGAVPRTGSLTWNAGSIPAGVYLVRATASGRTAAQRVVRTR